MTEQRAGIPQSAATGSQTPASSYASLWNRTIGLSVDGLLLLSAIGLLGFTFPTAPPVLLVSGLLMGSIYFSGFHASRWQATPGKIYQRIRVTDLGGGRLSLQRSVARLLAWCLSATPFMLWPLIISHINPPVGLGILGICLLPYFIAGFTARRQALHDLLAGTLVVRKEELSVTAKIKAKRINAVLWVLFIVTGFCASYIARVSFEDYSLRALNISYAIREVKPLQEKLQAFYDAHQRFPMDAAELGVPAVTPYPAGGSYRLQADGVILIQFSVHRELVGKTITIRPVIDDKTRKLSWECGSKDLSKVRLPPECRSG